MDQVYDDFHQQVTNKTRFTVSSELDSQLQSIKITNNILTSSKELIVHGTSNTSSSILLQTSDTRTVYTVRSTLNFFRVHLAKLQNRSMTCVCQVLKDMCFVANTLVHQYLQVTVLAIVRSKLMETHLNRS